MSGIDHKQGGSSLVQSTAGDAPAPGPGKRTLTGQLGPGGTAPEHTTAAAHQVAERDLNAVITVVARGPDGAVLARWRARGCWIGLLPAHHHGSHSPWGWTWSDRAASFTRIHTRADGTGGEPVEKWATVHGASTVDVIATATSDDEASEAHAAAPATGPAPAAADRSAGDLLAGLDPEHQRIVAEFERELGLDLDQDADDDPGHGRGERAGDLHGRAGTDTAIGGSGPGGAHARAGGDHEGSETHGAVEGSRFGSALGVEGGSEGGQFGGEGKPGDDGVRMAGAIAGGVIAVPGAVKGVVEILLIADAGDVTGAGAQAFKQLGKEAAKISAAALRSVVANEARVVCERELRATIQKMARTPRWQTLTVEERIQAVRIAYFELQRRFFRSFRDAAKAADRAATKALRSAAGARRVAAQESLDAARVGAEAAEVEPVAGRLPRNHDLAGKEFPRELLPPKYQERGLRFKRTGYPDFEPYAMTLPNGKKTVRIDLTGSRQADRVVANRAAGFQRPPAGYTWHHLEEEGQMMLVPRDLHDAVAHSGGVARNLHRTGASGYD